MKTQSAVKVLGRVRLFDPATGETLAEFANLVVYAGLEALVDALQAQAYINTWKYIGFGTSAAETTNDMTALTTEVSGGTYARLTATQGEGDNARTYKLTGTWTNTSGETRAVAELGIFSAASDGTMLARASTGDGGWSAKSIDNNGELGVEWTVALAGS